MGFIKNLLNKKTRGSPDKFIKKFLKEVNFNHVQIELYYDMQIILQVQSLKHVGFWFECNDSQKKQFKEGLILFFFLKNKGIENYEKYKNYLHKGNSLDMFEYKDKKNNITYILKFIHKDVTSLELGKIMSEVLNNIYKFSEKNPQIFFNIRYL